MRTFTSILVDVDALGAVHPALECAIQLARRCGARLRIVDVLDIPEHAARRLPAGAAESLIGRRRERLASFAAAAADLPADVDVLLGRPAAALIQEVRRCGHDLLVRSHARDLAAPRPSRLGTVDMQLFRQCPCPVWAVGPGAGPSPRRILAAVHATGAGPSEQALNRRILETAQLLAVAPGATVSVCQAWSAFGETFLQDRYSAEELASYLGAAEGEARRAVEALLASVVPDVRPQQVYLPKGQPESVIPPLVVSEGIDLVVMGTVARAGVAGLIMGNTAEHMLQRLPCSVIALKPDWFADPTLATERAEDSTPRPALTRA